MNDFYISYSGRKAYLTCPKRYKFIYIDKLSEVSDPKSTLFGNVIGKIFELFYEKKFWSNPDAVKVTLDLVESILDAMLNKDRITIDDNFRTELLSDLRYFTPFGIKTIWDHKLLTENSRAEVKLDVNYQTDNLNIRLGGRADFIHINGNQIWILDGKGSKWKDKYVDPEQLIWYAIQFFLKYHVAPSRLGFIFWKFPDDPVQWISYNDGSMRDNLKHTVETVKKIIDKEFDSSPTSYCNLCGFARGCEDGQSYINARKLAKSAPIDSSIFGIDNI